MSAIEEEKLRLTKKIMSITYAHACAHVGLLNYEITKLKRKNHMKISHSGVWWISENYIVKSFRIVFQIEIMATVTSKRIAPLDTRNEPTVKYHLGLYLCVVDFKIFSQPFVLIG